MALAAYPLAFGIQQFIEGLLWLAVDAGDEAGIALAARGFLFFSHLFWPAWVPFSVYLLETGPACWRQRTILALSLIGVLFGLSISVPTLVCRDWLAVDVVNGSIEYMPRLIYDGILDRQLLKLGYGAIILGALLLSRETLLQVFGGIIFAALLFAERRGPVLARWESSVTFGTLVVVSSPTTTTGSPGSGFMASQVLRRSLQARLKLQRFSARSCPQD